MMKNSILKLALIASLSLTLKGALAQGYTYEWLAPADAIQKVRDFEGNPNLAVTIKLMPTPNDTPLEAEYTLTAGRYEYHMDQAYRNGLVRYDEMWMRDKPDFYGPQFNLNDPNQQFLLPDQAQSIAWTFIQMHYPHPEVLNEKWVLPEVPATDTTRVSRYFTCTYIQNLGNMVGGPRFCIVDVDSILGQVISFHSSYFPVLMSTVPALTSDQAMAAAMNGMNVSNGAPMNDHIDLDVCTPDIMGVERLEYDVRFTGVGPANPTGMLGYDVMVDANTGETIEWDTLAAFIQKPTLPSPVFVAMRQRMAQASSSAPPSLACVEDGHKIKLAFEPRLVNGQPYMYAGYLCYGSDARLSAIKAGAVNITGRGWQISFKLGAKTYQLNGKVKRLSAPPILIEGKCYVPLEAFEAVLPFPIHYSRFLKLVSLEIHPTPHKISSGGGAAIVGAGAASLYGLSKLKRRAPAGSK